MTRCEFQIKKLYTLPGLCSLAVIFIIMNEMMKRPWTLYSFVGYYKLLEGRGIYEDYGIQLYNYRSKTLLQELRIIFPTGWTYFSDWNWSF